MSDALIRAEELANRLGVSANLIYRLARNGEIPAYRVGASWRFDEAAVKNALQQKAAS